MDPDEFLAWHRSMHRQRRMRVLLFRVYASLTLLTLVAMIAIYLGRTT